MALNKTPVAINFSKGLSTKVDPFQIPVGSFLALNNSVFTTEGRLTKRNGYNTLVTALPNAEQTTLTTLNDNLIATGSDLYSYNSNSKEWINKGTVQPVQLTTQPLVRVSTSQSSPDSAINASGLVCLVYMDSGQAYYQFSDSATGEQLVSRKALPTNSSSPRVFILGQYFVIMFYTVVSGVTHLQYLSIPQSTPTVPSSVTSITTSIRDANAGYDGFVANNNLYFASATGANTIEVRQLTSTLVVSSPATITGHTADLMSVTADISMTSPIVYVSFWDTSSNNGYTAAFNQNRLPVHASTQIITGMELKELTSVAANSVCSIFYEVSNTYGSGTDATTQTDYINSVTITQAGTVGSTTTILRSVGLASKAFFGPTGTIYMLATYGEQAQPTYFLIDSLGNIFMRLAYSNGGGYEPTQVLPSVSIIDGAFYTPYLIKDFLAAVNKNTNNPTGTPTSAIYTQTGVNLARFTINDSQQYSSEIAGALHLTGGQLWEYDGVKPVEHGFQVWPENVGAVADASGGSLSPQQYYYQFTYEWTDNQGNLHRSAPSIPLLADLTHTQVLGQTFTATFGEGDTAISVSSTSRLYAGQTVIDMTQADALTSPTTIVSLGSQVRGTFTTGSVTVTVPSTAGLFVGQVVNDLTTPGNIIPGTTIATIASPTTITLSATPSGNSAGTPGDLLVATSNAHPTITISAATHNAGTADAWATTTVALSAAFANNSKTLYVDSTTGFSVGQTLTDTTNGAALVSATITAIDATNKTITISTATAAMSASNSLSTAQTTFTAAFGSLSSTITASSVTGLHVGQFITDVTTPGNIPANTYITAINTGTSVLTLSNQTQGVSTVDSIKTVSTTFNGSFIAGSNKVIVSSTNNLFVGQVLTDAAPQNLPTGVTITAIDTLNNLLTISANATGTAADTVTTPGALSVTLTVPTLRLTYKTQPNPVRIVGYRWSVAQQVYYQFTSLTSPVINDPSVDFVTITDTQSDAAILGNTILYTTGGVVENIAAPASVDTALFNNRLFLIDAEDRNLLWFSKQVIEAVPVEMSDLLTLYVAPTSGAQGSTGPMTALGAMDDKLIIFKHDAIYYINGSGPDNTGANSSFSDAIFITSAVGCSNPSSVVLIPMGIMFQSDKGIWILGRDLTTNYIGAPVEKYNANTVMSAQSIPGTNQVRFVLDNNVTLMYDYFYSQWGTFNNTYAISSTLYQSQHTYLNKFGSVFQESPGQYLDGSTPVLMSLTTGWINVAGLQGYERFYFANLLGTYFTPFTLSVELAYDYNPSSTQTITVLPDNYAPNWGGEALWGSGTSWGGPGNVFSARLFPSHQKCESFQVTINEVYDSSFGVAAGQGLTLSGLGLVVGVKKGYRTQSARKSYG